MASSHCRLYVRRMIIKNTFFGCGQSLSKSNGENLKNYFHLVTKIYFKWPKLVAIKCYQPWFWTWPMNHSWLWFNYNLLDRQRLFSLNIEQWRVLWQYIDILILDNIIYVREYDDSNVPVYVMITWLIWTPLSTGVHILNH